MRVALALFLLLAGCAQPSQTTTVVDTFCLTSQKRLWSINDSPQSIRDAEAWNAAIDRRCAAKRS